MHAVLVLFWLLAALAAPAAHAAPFDSDAIDDCVEATPHAVSVPFGDPIELRVLVLLDGVTQGDAAATMAAERVSYEPLGIDLTVGGYRAVSLTGTDSIGLIEQSRALLGGKRPPTAHIVYTFTNKDMTGGAFGSATAGQADCIGGVAFDDAAFAVGELHADELESDQPAKIGAHELGHLMGAHHHYANCGEGLAVEPGYPCTLMINDVGLASLNFSTFNAAVVRGHAEEFAKQLAPAGSGSTATEPEPAPTPTPSPTPAASATPAPAPASEPGASGAGGAQPGAQPGGGSGARAPAKRAREGELCVAARRLLARTRSAESAARRAVRKARSARRGASAQRAAAARRRAARRLRDRTAARRAAQRSVTAHCR